MGYISEVNLNGQTHKVGSSLYGTCGTTASTATKVVALADYSTLTVGTTIRVKFSYGNSVANPKLNVNGLGAIPIYKYGTTTPGASSELSWNAGAVISFTYDGTAWMMNDWNDMSASIASVADGLAILATGDTHASITSGQFVYVRNHGSAEGFSGNAILADGLYVAQANISANGALTTSNLTADGSGGLNALKGEVDSLNSKLALIKKFTVSGTTDAQGLLSLSAIPYPNVPFYIGTGTGDIATFFNGSTSGWQPYARITDYNGSVKANKQYAITVLCVSGTFNS